MKSNFRIGHGSNIKHEKLDLRTRIKVRTNNVADDRDNHFTKHPKHELGLECHVID